MSSIEPITDIFVIAPPYSGKTSRIKAADEMRSTSGGRTISMGSLVGSCSSGGLIPDEKVIPAWSSAAEISKGAFSGREYFHDGMPRTQKQAAEVCTLLSKAQLFSSSIFLIIDRDKEWCLQCFEENQKKGISRNRKDDARATLQRRLDIYFTELPQIITELAYYRAKTVTLHPSDSPEVDAHNLLLSFRWIEQEFVSLNRPGVINDFTDGMPATQVSVQ